MQVRWFFFMAVFGLICLSGKKKPEYLTAKTMDGDGVYSFLRRYDLDRFTCNHDEFYKINKLKKNAKLLPGKEYNLPILLHTYDGKSIRTTLGIKDLDLAIRIRDFNRSMEERNLRQQTFEKSRILWVPHHELKCPAPTIPAVTIPDPEASKIATKPRHYSIFGTKYAYTPLESQKLTGKIFYVIAGHGGPDSGATGKRSGHTLCEDEYAYDVSLRLVRLLIANGGTAYMINRDLDDGIRDENFLKCDQHEVVWGNLKVPVNQKARLFQRSDAVNDLYEKHKKQGVVDQKVIEIHVDSRSKKLRADVFFYHYPKNEKGKKLAETVHQTFASKYKKYRKGAKYNGTVTARDLHTLRECKPTALYVELANIQNPFDQQRIILAVNRQALANWLYEGLVK